MLWYNSDLLMIFTVYSGKLQSKIVYKSQRL